MLLCRAMIHHGIGIPHEYFHFRNAARIGPRVGIEALRNGGLESDGGLRRAYIRELINRRTVNGIFSAKVQWWQFANFLNNREGIDLFQNAHFIYLYREDLLAQAISLHISHLTGRWGSDDLITSEPKSNPNFFDKAAIDHFLKEVSTHDANWRLFFAHNQISPFIVSYERLSRDVAQFLRSMVECFGLELPTSDFSYDEEKTTATRASLVPPSSKIKARFLLAHQQVFQAPQVAIKTVSEGGRQTGEYQKSETPARSIATNLAAHQGRSRRYAIITPYYKEARDILERCIKSVREQTVTTDHFLVADGLPQDWIDGTGVRHIRLDRSHADYGDTPRGIGAMTAVSEGYQAIGFLDADCWLEPDHVHHCLELASLTGREGCDYVIARRHKRRPDGTIINTGEEPPEQHVDTSCFFFLRTGFHVLPVWNAIPREVAIVGDRVFYTAVKANSLRSVVAKRKTVNYTWMWEVTYRALGEQPPPGAKPNPDHHRVQRWISELPDDERAVINRLIQTRLEDLYPAQFSTAPTPDLRSKVGRNDPCPCGSGLRYKRCCGTFQVPQN